eukprot:9251704-Karenia_brevis.AAC.1
MDMLKRIPKVTLTNRFYQIPIIRCVWGHFFKQLFGRSNINLFARESGKPKVSQELRARLRIGMNFPHWILDPMETNYPANLDPLLGKLMKMLKPTPHTLTLMGRWLGTRRFHGQIRHGFSRSLAQNLLSGLIHRIRKGGRLPK